MRLCTAKLWWCFGVEGNVEKIKWKQGLNFKRTHFLFGRNTKWVGIAQELVTIAVTGIPTMVGQHVLSVQRL